MCGGVSGSGTSPGGKSKPKLALDLCSGTGSVGRRLAERGYRVISVDVRTLSDPAVYQHICVDILRWDYSRIRPGFFDLIAASPPVPSIRRPRQLPLANWRRRMPWS